MNLEQLIYDFAQGLVEADSMAPIAVNQRSGKPFSAGIGPHTVAQTVNLVMSSLSRNLPNRYMDRYRESVPYPKSRQKCDLCFGNPPSFNLAVEVKMIRLLGDNGKPNDNLVTHILSPYPAHRSSFTDVEKLLSSGLALENAILMYAYDYDDWPSLPLIEAFEMLVRPRYCLGTRIEATFDGLMHPVHSRGTVYAWQLYPSPGHNKARERVR